MYNHYYWVNEKLTITTELPSLFAIISKFMDVCIRNSGIYYQFMDKLGIKIVSLPRGWIQEIKRM
jgi:hypothetical protein